MNRSSFIFGPWHPPTAHFPIVCSILGVFALWIGGINGIEWLTRAAGALWLLTFLTALLSVLTGHLFADSLGLVHWFSILPPDGPKEKTGQLHYHALVGTSGLVLSLFMVPGSWKLMTGQATHHLTIFFLGILAAILFGLAGHEGGEMVFRREMLPLSGFHSKGSSKKKGHINKARSKHTAH